VGPFQTRTSADGIVGFHAQQAIEKWLKAAMALSGLDEARIHDIGRLLEILGEAGVNLPPAADHFDDRSIYAVPLLVDSVPEVASRVAGAFRARTKA
jgi:hypothetical protein